MTDRDESLGDVETDTGAVVSVYKSGRSVDIMTTRPLIRLSRDEAVELRDLLSAAVMTGAT